MEVTKQNFKDVLKTLPKILEEASFIAIDGEFTGLHHNVKPSPYDTPEERYEKLNQGSMDFLLIQFGMCVFKYDKKSSGYLAYPYNFYVFPRPVMNSRKPDHRFLCQSSSMDFLSSFGFDFNKVFKDGIPYLTRTEKDALKDHIQEKHALYQQQESSSTQPSPGFVSPAAKKPVEVPSEQKDFVDSVCKRVDEFVANSEEQILNLDPCTGFQRKLTFQTVKARHESGLMLTTKAGEKGERYIEVTKASEEDKKMVMQKRLQAQLDEVDQAAGFSQVIDLITSTGKPVVGHNMMLDIMHTMRQFSCPLPDTLAEFKEMASCVFPKLVDTKVMAGTQPFKERIPMNGLAELEKTLNYSPFKRPEFEIPDGYPAYSATNGQYHEAAYDAFITGTCFATMANYLGTLTDPPSGRVSPTCSLMEPFHNKVCLFRVQDLPYVNLSGPDLIPPRDHVFHLTFPGEWRLHHIQNLFSPFGQVFISWIDQTTAFVSLANKEEAASVMTTLGPCNDITLQTFRDYRRAAGLGDPSSTGQSGQATAAGDGGAPVTTAAMPPPPAPQPPSRGLKRPHEEEAVDPLAQAAPEPEDSEVAELTAAGVGGKKMKSMNPNAPVFVSRRSVSPVDMEAVTADQSAGLPAADEGAPDGTSPAAPPSGQDPDKREKKAKQLFEEPDTW